MNQEHEINPPLVEQRFEDISTVSRLYSPDKILGFLALNTGALSVSQELDKVRTTLVTIAPDKRHILEEYLEKITPRRMQRLVRANTDPSWSAWIAQRASEDALLRIVEENHAVVEVHAAHEGVRNDIDALQGSFMATLDGMQQDGYIPTDPRPASAAVIRFGDIFDTHLTARPAYFEADSSTIFIGQGYRGPRDTFVQEMRTELYRIVPHELVHGLLCRSYYDVTSPLSVRWFNEGATEIISKEIRTRMGQSGIEDDVYINERMLIAEIMRPIDDMTYMTRILARAYTGNAEHRDEFLDVIDKMHGTKDVIEKISTVIELEKNRNMSQGYHAAYAEVLALRATRLKLMSQPKDILLKGVDQLLIPRSRKI